MPNRARLRKLAPGGVGRKVFFFEKKKQKTFVPWRVRWPGHVRHASEVFGSFFKVEQPS
jgi:hypothetical protein